MVASALGGCGGDAEEQRYQLGQRMVQPLNSGWEFRLQAQKKARDVSLPHTWNAKDGQDGGDDYYRGVGIYQRTLRLDEAYREKRLYLHFDGAAIVTEVRVNGQLAGTHSGSYGAFRIDITGLVTSGQDNLIEVRVDNSEQEHIAPLSADFTFFGGLYRQARLIATDAVHIDAMNHASSGVFWSQDDISRERASLGVRSKVVNETRHTQSVQVEAQLATAEGEVVASVTRDLLLEPGQQEPVELALSLDNPRLWHGRRDPYLYRANLILRAGAQVMDSVEEAIGLRFFHVDNERGFYLNGEPYPLYGINRMADFKGKGTAVSREEHERDLALIMELGATSIRLGHQQRDDYVYRRADELGLVVWAEIPLINRIEQDDRFSENLRQQALELVRQNYNRSSIMFWGLYNEITLKPGPDPRPLVKQLDKLVRAEDPHRLTTAAVAAEGGVEDSLVTTPDLISFNRYDGWYYGNFNSFAQFLDDMRAAAPHLRFGISEYGAGASIEPAFQTDDPVAQDHSEQYQALYHEAYWDAMRGRPWLWGNYIWVLADFAVDDRDEGDTPGRNDKGLVTFDRKVKKDAFYWYKANWSEEPVLHLTGRRHSPRNRGKIEIKAYTNLASVELTVNGTSLGVRQGEGRYRLTWDQVPLAMGRNRIEVSGKSGDKVISDSIELERVTSSDTSLSSALLGVDQDRGLIYNAPAGASLDDLQALLTLPDSGRIELVNKGQETLGEGDRIRVTAQDGTTSREYELHLAPLSVARPVSASSEIAGDMSIGPLDIPEMSAAKANDGIITRGDNGLTEINIWNTMGGKSHWWKVDLGAEYHLEKIEIVWPQHSDMIEPGPMSYAVEVAGDFTQTFDNFSETYEEIVDQRENQRVGTTVDKLGVTGRFVQVRLLKSEITANTPLVGAYPIYGAEEITVTGGLLYSDSLTINYRDRTVAMPGNELDLLDALQVVGGGTIEMVDAGGAALPIETAPQAGDALIVRDKTRRLAEKYSLIGG